MIEMTERAAQHVRDVQHSFKIKKIIKKKETVTIFVNLTLVLVHVVRIILL